MLYRERQPPPSTEIDRDSGIETDLKRPTGEMALYYIFPPSWNRETRALVSRMRAGMNHCRPGRSANPKEYVVRSSGRWGRTIAETRLKFTPPRVALVAHLIPAKRIYSGLSLIYVRAMIYLQCFIAHIAISLIRSRGYNKYVYIPPPKLETGLQKR